MRNFFLAYLALLAALVGPATALDPTQEIKSDARSGYTPKLNLPGEIGINPVDGRLLYRNEAGAVAGGLLPDLDVSGYLKFRNGLTLGRYQGGKFISQPDAIQIRGAGSTGPIDDMTAQGRSLSVRARDRINVRDAPYNAKCDGVTDDTLAFRTAIAAASSAFKHIYIPTGVCMVTDLAYSSSSYALMFSFIGDGKNLTFIRRLGTGNTKPLFTLGDINQTKFLAKVNITGITFDAVDKSAPAVVSYDLVRSSMTDVGFTKGSVGYLSYGGIGNLFYNADAEGNGIGAKFIKYSSRTGGGYPNHIKWTGALGGNDQYGLYFDDGINFLCDFCDIEGNGKVLGDASGGVYIGAGMGSAVATVRNFPGVTLRNSWLEANMGLADVVANSGLNTIENTKFFSTPSQTTHDALFLGGNYVIRDSTTATSKTANIKDTPNVNTGNYIEGGFWPNINTVRLSEYKAPSLHNINVPFSATAGANILNGPLKTNHATLQAGRLNVALTGDGKFFSPNDKSWISFIHTVQINKLEFILPFALGDGQIITITTITPINVLVVAAQNSAIVVGSPTTLTPSTPVSFGYDLTNNRWSRVN